MFTVVWNTHAIGSLDITGRDMWYLDGVWTSFNTPESIRFEKMLKAFDFQAFLKDPATALRIHLVPADNPQKKMYCLAMILKDQDMVLRQVVAPEALDMFFPDR